MAKVAASCWVPASCNKCTGTDCGNQICFEGYYNDACLQRESTEAQERNRIIESENKKRADDIAKLEKDISNTERKIQTLEQLPSADEVTAQLLQANLNLLRAYKGNLERRKKTPVLEPVPLPITPAKDGTTFMFTFEVEGENGHRMEVSVEPGDIESLNRALLSSMEAQTMMLGLGAPLISRTIRRGISKGASALPAEVIGTFKERIREMTLAYETQLPRLFGGTSSQLGRKEGIYLTTKSGTTGNEN